MKIFFYVWEVVFKFRLHSSSLALGFWALGSWLCCFNGLLTSASRRTMFARPPANVCVCVCDFHLEEELNALSCNFRSTASPSCPLVLSSCCPLNSVAPAAEVCQLTPFFWPTVSRVFACVRWFVLYLAGRSQLSVCECVCMFKVYFMFGI